MLLACVLAAGSAASQAQTDDELFLDARDAYQRGDSDRLSRISTRLGGHPLYPYVIYWQLRSRLADVGRPAIDTFLNDQQDTLLAERLRADWLRLLGRNRDWTTFEQEYRGIGVPDTELTCYALQARLALQQDQTALKDGRQWWFQGNAQPDSCGPLFDAMLHQGLLDEDDVWARIRLALEAGNVSFVPQLVGYLPTGKRPDPRQFESAARNPQKILERKALSSKTRADREVIMFALGKLAKTLPAVAATQFEKLRPRFSAAEQRYVWGQLAVSAAMKHRPEALEWFARAGDGLTDRQLNWQARAALQAADWTTVSSAVLAMSPKERQLPAWRYWHARAQLETSQGAEAYAQLAALSFDHGFYGQLAMEELGTSVAAAPESYRPSEDEVKAMEQVPGLRRALAFYHLGLRYEGALEWRWTIRGLSDKELLAAAELAARNGWYERSIDTADRTKDLHNFSLRFPLPYRDVVMTNTRQLDLDEAWVYGLVRQESRFSAEARSSAGAMGLMQLMPSTAKQVARRMGLPGFDRQSVHAVDTNVSLGTYYLRQLLDGLNNHPVLAAAAYNAGSSRAREWRVNQPLEGAVYAEIIPFTETRDYVRKVMSNTMHYARVLGQPFIPLKQRLGQVDAKPLSNE